MIIVRIQNQNISVAVLTHDVIIVENGLCMLFSQRTSFKELNA